MKRNLLVAILVLSLPALSFSQSRGTKRGQVKEGEIRGVAEGEARRDGKVETSVAEAISEGTVFPKRELDLFFGKASEKGKDLVQLNSILAEKTIKEFNSSPFPGVVKLFVSVAKTLPQVLETVYNFSPKEANSSTSSVSNALSLGLKEAKEQKLEAQATSVTQRAFEITVNVKNNVQTKANETGTMIYDVMKAVALMAQGKWEKFKIKRVNRNCNSRKLGLAGA